VKDPTYYCVRAFRGRRDRPTEVSARWCASAREARATALRLGPDHCLVIAYAFEGRPEYGVFGEPRLLARHGELPGEGGA
jgi:hypothetical protein